MRKFTTSSILTALLLLIISVDSFATNYVSVASGSWNTSTNWSPVGIPNNAVDNVTIGHNITISSGTFSIGNVTINGGASLTVNGGFSGQLYINGLLDNSGTFTGTGVVAFLGTGTVITGSGSTTGTGRWYMGNASGQAINSNVVITKSSGDIVLLNSAGSVSVTNNGSVTLASGGFTAQNASNASTWTNAANSTLSLRAITISPISLVASANGNTVIFTGASSGTIPTPVGSQYYNLTISGNPKNLPNNLTILNDFNILTDTDLSSKNLTVGGNWISTVFNVTANISTFVTFNGTTQSISRSSGSEVIGNATFAGSGTKTLSGNLGFHAFVINSGVTVNGGSGTIIISRNWTDNGTFIPSTSTVRIAGGGAQTITRSTGTETFNILEIAGNGAKTLGSNISIANTLSFTSSNASFSTGSNSCTMVSDATATARIAPITVSPAPTITGSFVMQRFVSARNSNWADLSSPVLSSTMSDWDNEIYMSGVGGPDGNVTSNNSIWYSVYSYIEPSNTWSPVTSAAATSLTPCKGWEMWLGSNEVSLSATTIDTRGAANTGTKTISVTNSASNPDANARGWNLVGNPYQSFLSWSSVLAANPTLNSSYQIFDNNSGTYAVYGAGTEIPPTQGFWIFTPSSTTMSFQESHKATTISSTFLRQANVSEIFALKISNLQNPFWHKASIKLDESSTRGFDKEDAVFIKSRVKEAPSITLQEEDYEYVLHSFSPAEGSVSIPVLVRAGVDGIYTIEPENFSSLNASYSCAILEDKFTNKMIDLSSGSYSFEAKTSDDAHRFVLHLVDKSSSCEELMREGVAAASQSAFIYHSAEGLSVKFDFEQTTAATISVYNVVGQNIIEPIQVDASKQTMLLSLPSNLHGVYFVTIHAGNEVITKKTVF
jgi:hypothetical protein